MIHKNTPAKGIINGIRIGTLSRLCFSRTLMTHKLRLTRAKMDKMIKLVNLASDKIGSQSVISNKAIEKKPVAATGVRVFG